MLYLTTNRLSLSNSKSSHQVNTKETPHYTRGGGYHFPYPHSQPDSGTINFWEWNGNADLGLSFLSHSQRVVLSFILLGSEQARTHRVSMLSHPFACLGHTAFRIIWKGIPLGWEPSLCVDIVSSACTSSPMKGWVAVPVRKVFVFYVDLGNPPQVLVLAKQNSQMDFQRECTEGRGLYWLPQGRQVRAEEQKYKSRR